MRFLTPCLALILAASLCGCAMSGPSAADDNANNPQNTESETDNGGIYFADFNDIPIPDEMTVDHKQSLVIGTISRQTGVLVLTGRVNAPSLYRFYYDSMPGQGFMLRGFFKHARSLMIFEKPGKDVIILVDEGTISTKVEIWVVLRSDTPDTILHSTTIPQALPQTPSPTSTGSTAY